MEKTLLKALRSKVRFATNRGPMTIEQLFEMPLTSRDDFNLEMVAQAVHTELEKAGAKSFVGSKSNPKKVELQVKMDIVIWVIQIKEAENEAKRDKVSKDAQRELLRQALANAQSSALSEMTVEQIQAKLKELGED